jgi:hypothetical protein
MKSISGRNGDKPMEVCGDTAALNTQYSGDDVRGRT